MFKIVCVGYVNMCWVQKLARLRKVPGSKFKGLGSKGSGIGF
jgi:hypothetical protein